MLKCEKCNKEYENNVFRPYCGFGKVDDSEKSDRILKSEYKPPIRMRNCIGGRKHIQTNILIALIAELQLMSFMANIMAL